MADAAVLDVNVDMGESFGRWKLGDDEAMMPFISSVSIACGFHAGDPGTIRRTVHAAVAHGLQIGAHVAVPDLIGFGRRRMAMSPEDVRNDALYQIGALKAFVDAEGGTLGHVKPHGALYAMCSADPELAGAVAQATAEVDRDLLVLLLSEDVAPAVRGRGVRLATEAFPDLNYNPDGTLMIEAVKQAWDPEKVARRALRIARERKLDAADGSELEVSARSVCLHGDAPNAVAVARAVRERLDGAGIEVVALREIVARETPAGAHER
ncbi:MAG: LamB/YcsF family protein [Solirubrobacterales bacterium]|nr:LamB/YcsF family protein [Solirubrobacterales bacterium]MBV9716453.1 LamB/YcsF family protein [Solirubrobacterales bacterium]